MKILIIPNFNKQNAWDCTQRLIEKLVVLGCQVLMEDSLAGPFLPHVVAGPLNEQLQSCDLIFSVGGDGTILHAAILAASVDKPILGINTGRLGFLAQLEPSQLEQLPQIIEGDYTIDERMLLKASVYHEQELIHTGYALNDVVISRMALGKMVDIHIDCDGRPFTNYRADGIIFSTPTGSTAYSLSAGGSIVDPTIHSILLTPICPHSLFDRSIIFAPDKKLTVSTREINNPAEANLAIDGVVVDGLYQHDSIVIERGERSAKLIQLKNTDFYDILTQKMMMRGN